MRCADCAVPPNELDITTAFNLNLAAYIPAEIPAGPPQELQHQKRPYKF